MISKIEIDQSANIAGGLNGSSLLQRCVIHHAFDEEFVLPLF